ncbi:MAG: tetratricopeptide repeat protein, partial [Sphingobacteriales bacterium]
MKVSKMNPVSNYLVAALLLCGSAASVQGQEHFAHKQGLREIIKAQEELEHGHFRLALQTAAEYETAPGLSRWIINYPDKEKAALIRALSALRTDAPGADDSALALIRHTVHAPTRMRLSLALGHFYFRNERLAEAIPFFETADISNLSNEEIANLRFELAYAYFNSRNFEKAAPLFASIKEVSGRYYLAGNYYHGLLSYNNGNYDEALSSFRKVENDVQYRNIVPYYIAEIYYFKGDKATALQEAVRLIARPEKLYYDTELHLLAAQVHFEEQRYTEALPYFEHYYNNSEKIRKEELYEMGYSYYRTNEWRNAIEKFRPLSSQQDSLGQTAMYLLGDCYLKINDKKSARNAFGICSEMNFNHSQREAALLLYGKLSYDMGYYDIALNSLRTMVRDYPSSAYATEAKTLIGDLLLRSNSYADAFEELRNVTARDEAYRAAWQKITYGYAMQQMQLGNTAFSDSLLTLSLREPADRARAAAAHFWKGDIAYNAGRFGHAVENFSSYIKLAAGVESQVEKISTTATMANAYLNLGFASMETGDFAAARAAFARSRQGGRLTTAHSLTAVLREADAAFMQKNFREALPLYEQVIAANVTESDEARIRKAVILG